MAYPEAVADGIAGALFRAQRAFGHSIMLLFGHSIMLLSDEAHSDMANGGTQNPCLKRVSLRRLSHLLRSLSDSIFHLSLRALAFSGPVTFFGMS